jgi:Cu(I)/Ag(I) efflux system periplasmic protein CusF
MKNKLLYLAVSASMWAVPALAQPASDTNPQPPAQAAARPASALTDGEVRKVEKDTGKITIRHGAIANLDMPPMTMVFHVSDPTLLDSVQPGDPIRFAAEKLGGVFTVTLLQRRN